MMEFGPTFIWTIINLLVLYWFLKRILFKKVTDFMDKRSESIKETLINADHEKVQAKKIKEEYDKLIKGSKEDAQRIIDEASKNASKESEKIIAAAKKESENILAKSREEIERERDQMLKEVKNQVALLAIAAASKIIEVNMNTESNKALVNRFINKDGV